MSAPNHPPATIPQMQADHCQVGSTVLMLIGFIYIALYVYRKKRGQPLY